MIKKIALFSLVSAVVFMLAGIHSASAAAKVIIRSHTFQGSVDMLKEMIDKFEKENPGIDVELESKPGGQYEELLMVSLAAGAGPDIFRVGDWNMLRYINKKIVAPYMPEAFGVGTDQGIANEYIPGVLNRQYHQGKLYALPEDITPLLLVVNMDHLKEAGIGKLPSNYEEFINAAVKTTKVNTNGQRMRSGFEWKYHHELWNTIQIAPLLRSYGASLFDETGENLLLDSAEALQAMQYYYDTAHKWKFSDPAFALSEGIAFERGNISMTTGGPWMTRVIASTNTVKNWDVATWDTGPIKNTVIYAWNYGINFQSKNKNEANRLVAFIHRKDNVNRVMELTGFIQGQKMWSETSYVRGNPKIKPWFDALSYSQYMDPLLEFPRVSKAVTKMFENMAEGGMRPREALEIAVSEIKKAMK
jgi:multiple sugar transport system substrate-binding protein